MYLNQIKKNEKLRNWTMIGVITTLVTRGMAALLQSSVELVEWSSEVKVYSVISPPPKKSLTKEKG